MYNTDPGYVDECLRSVTESSLSDYEILFVDDGSSVDYGALCEKYPLRYSKIENRGLFGARLYGISIAKGEYVAFVDSDDTVSKNYHLPMILAAERTGADIVINDWAFSSGGLRTSPISDSTIGADVDVSGDALAFYTSQRGREHSYFVQWNKLFRRALLEKSANDIKKSAANDKHIVYAEDALMNFYNFKNATRVVGIHTGFYFYRIHGEQSVVAQSEERLRSQIELMSFALDEMEGAIDGRDSKERIRDDINAWRALMSRSHFDSAKRSGFCELYGLIKERYRVDNLTRPLSSDGSAYRGTEIVGAGFSKIDEVLTEAFTSGKEVILRPADKTKYVRRFIKSYSSLTDGRISADKCGTPLEKNGASLKQRILYNPIIYKLGFIFFKKGSRLRRFLKKLLGSS